MRYRDATRMGKIYLLPDGVTRPVAGWEEQGPDADDPALTLDEWRARIAKHSGELKNLLRNQAFVGRHRQRLLGRDPVGGPPRAVPHAGVLAPDEVDALYAATREVLPGRSSSCGSWFRRVSRSSSASS